MNTVRPDHVTDADLMDRLTTARNTARRREEALALLVNRTRDLDTLLASPMTNKQAQVNAVAIHINGLETGLDRYRDVVTDSEHEAVLWLVEAAKRKASALGLRSNAARVGLALPKPPANQDERTAQLDWDEEE